MTSVGLRVALVAALAVVVACAARKTSPPGVIEARTPAGATAFTVTPVDGGLGLELRQPGEPLLVASRTEGGATVKNETGATVAILEPGPAGHKLSVGFKTYRVRFGDPRRVIHVLDEIGVTVVVYEQLQDRAIARDATTRHVAAARREGDHQVVDAGERVGSVHDLPDHRDRDLAALVLLGPALPMPARAALFATILPSKKMTEPRE